MLRLVRLRGHGPDRRQRISGTHRSPELAGVLEICNRRTGEVHARARRNERAREWAVQDAPAEARLARELLVDVQRVEVAEHSRAKHQVRLGNREARAEGLADPHFVVPLAWE